MSVGRGAAGLGAAGDGTLDVSLLTEVGDDSLTSACRVIGLLTGSNGGSLRAGAVIEGSLAATRLAASVDSGPIASVVTVAGRFRVEGESTPNGPLDHFEGLRYPDPSRDDRVALSVNG